MSGKFSLKKMITQGIIIGLPKLSKKELTVYYTKLFKIRETELKIAKEYSKQEMMSCAFINRRGTICCCKLVFKKN